MIYRVLTLALLILSVSLAHGQELLAEAGLITIAGDGTLAFNGQGEFVIEGEGMLFVVDRTDEAMIHIESTKRIRHKEQVTRGNTVHIYRRFNGTAMIKGDDIAIVMEGINISMSVSGTGSMFVEGEGTYAINNGDPLPWSDGGDLITIGVLEP